jgi:acyl carrier protein
VPESPAGAAAALEDLILTAVTQVLYLEPGGIGPEEDFIAAGLDSILAVEFVQLLRQHGGAAVPVEQVHKARTARALAQAILTGTPASAPDAAAADQASPVLAQAVPAPAPASPVPAAVSPVPAPASPVPARVGPAPAPVGPVPAAVSPVPAPASPVPAPVSPVPAEASSLPAQDGRAAAQHLSAAEPEPVAGGNGAGGGPGGPAPAEAAGAPAGAGGASAEALRGRLREMIGESLYLPPDNVSTDTEFGEMGLDSILAVEFVSRIKSDLGVPLTVQELRSHPTVAALAQHLSAAEPELAGGPAR